MSENKKTGWNAFASAFYKRTKKEDLEKPLTNSYAAYENAYCKSTKEEEVKPETPSHIVVEEQYEKFVEEHIIEEPEQVIKTEQDAYEAAIADGGMPIELQETPEMHLENGPTPRPAEEPDFTQEELEAFKELNADKFIHETNDVHVHEIVDHYDVPNEVPVIEEAIETKVKKVKVSKPKAPKSPKKPGRPKKK